MKKHIYIIAGEESGDILGAEILKNFKKGEFKISGIGGNRMKKYGLTSLFDYDDLSVHGIIDILNNYSMLKSRINMTIDDIKKKNPDIVITIDSQGFSSRIAQGTSELKNHKMQVVAPSVWASKKYRKETYPKLFDSIVCLFPFETKLFKNVKTFFAGHPSCDNIQNKPKNNLRKKYKINNKTKIIGFLPGSRDVEVKHCLDMYVDAIKLLNQNVHIFAVSIDKQKKNIESKLKQSGLKYTIINQDEKNDALQHCDCAITKAGTITLELSVLGVPMVVAHKLGFITYWLTMMLYRIPYFSLPNIILNKGVVPELTRQQPTPQKIATIVNYILKSKGKNQKDNFDKIRKSLKSPNGNFGKTIYKQIKNIIK